MGLKVIVQPPDGQWDLFVKNHPRAHFLQISGWGQLKSEFGWTARRIGFGNTADGDLIAGAQVLYRRLPLNLGKLAYIPFGPLLDWSNKPMVQEVFQALHREIRHQGAAFLKIEPGFQVDLTEIKALKFIPSPQTVQPPSTILVDLDGEGVALDEESVLKRMNQGTRRNIRKSEKSDVVVREGTAADVETFCRLLNMTGQRQGFGVHTSLYYERIFSLFAGGGSPVKAAFLMASFTDETTGIKKDLAGVLVFTCGANGWYIAGGSSDEERDRRASFGVQWAAMQWAKTHGATLYDMYGIPDEDETRLEAEFETRDDGLWGVYRFKRGWGGRVARTVGTWDYVYNPAVYWAYRAYLRMRGRGEEN